MREEQNQNPFAMALHWHSPSEPPPNLPATVESEPGDRLAFDPVAVREQRDGWTPERQRAFIEALADCGIVREAAARVGKTEQSAHWLRRRGDALSFNLAWEAALQLGGDRLRSIAYERAVEGTVKRHFYKGEIVGEDRIYDNRLLIYLLGKSQPSANAMQAREVIRNWDSWMQAIEDGLDRPQPAADLGESSPVWQGEDGGWWTSFPAPAGFNGAQFEPDEPGGEFHRECTLDEIAAIEAAQARATAEKERRRDLYFDPDRMRLEPPR
jgi:hypothetical protein